jgi:hypothetical protein
MISRQKEGSGRAVSGLQRVGESRLQWCVKPSLAQGRSSNQTKATRAAAALCPWQSDQPLIACRQPA